jgi:hypothetical protein
MISRLSGREFAGVKGKQGMFLGFCAIAERPGESSRGFQAAVAGQPDTRRGATVEINAGSRIQASLRDATVWKTFPWAEAYGYRLGLAARGSGKHLKIELRPETGVTDEFSRKNDTGY